MILFHLLSSAEATQEGEEQEEKRGGGGRRAAFATRVAVCNLRVKWKKLLANEKSLHCTQVFSINNARFFSFFFPSFDPIQLTNCDVIKLVEMCVLWLCFGIEFISNPHRGLAQLSSAYLAFQFIAQRRRRRCRVLCRVNNYETNTNTTWCIDFHDEA